MKPLTLNVLLPELAMLGFQEVLLLVSSKVSKP